MKRRAREYGFNVTVYGNRLGNGKHVVVACIGVPGTARRCASERGRSPSAASAEALRKLATLISRRRR